MNLLYITLINIILIFIASVILNNRINKKSSAFLLEEYTREVEKLIVELNRALEDVLNISEQRLKELKRVIKKAEKILNNPAIKAALSLEVEKNLKETKGAEIKRVEDGINKGESTEQVGEIEPVKSGITGKTGGSNLLEKTKRLVAMGYSKQEIASILHINRAEVDFLLSLSR